MSQIVKKVLCGTGRSLLIQSRNGSSHSPSAFKPVVMNDLPTPSGSWQELYNANQKRYNLHLLLGLTLTAVTLAVGYQSGAFYLNVGPELRNKK